MSTSAHETMPSPTMPPPAGVQVPDLPTPPPAALPIAEAELPRLAATPPPSPMAAAPPPVTMLLPGSESELPRLGEPGAVTPSRGTVTPNEPTFDMASLEAADAPVLPTTAPQVMPAQVAPPEAPAGTESAATPATRETDEAAPVQRDHPMAHLMGTTAPATEASKRAAEARAEIQKRSKRIKIAVLTGFAAAIAAAVVYVGPWLVNAVNEAGNTSDEPAVETVEQP